MSALEIPETKSGRLICIAQLKVTPGQESVIEELMSAARDYAVTEKEPGTKTYRTTRIIDQQGKPTGEYVVFEEYSDKASFLAHAGGPPIQAFLEKKGIVAETVIRYAEEF
ncbi:hypothetical protein C8R43DRAFT_438211 [Mycena crocata]|nr:hypothetical protein C8R43DRAFT_438211 [Mycena crocata]